MRNEFIFFECVFFFVLCRGFILASWTKIIFLFETKKNDLLIL